jgi:hypothetical protein
MVAYITAGHAQIEFSGRTVTLCELPRQAEQKNGQALLGITLPEQQQQFMAMPDFALMILRTSCWIAGSFLANSSKRSIETSQTEVTPIARASQLYCRLSIAFSPSNSPSS